jgi:AhpC/TSA family
MARAYGEYLRRGATIAAIVIDSPGQNAAMVAKLALPFPVLSDPGGDGAIKPFGLWDDAGAMSKPAVVVVAPDGREVFRYTGVDFMDRPHDDDVLTALDGLGLAAISRPIATVPHLPPAPGPRALPLPDLAVYMRGVRSSSQALARRARDPWDRGEAERTTKMAESFIAAQGATRRLLGSD